MGVGWGVGTSGVPPPTHPRPRPCCCTLTLCVHHVKQVPDSGTDVSHDSRQALVGVPGVEVCQLFFFHFPLVQHQELGVV